MSAIELRKEIEKIQKFEREEQVFNATFKNKVHNFQSRMAEWTWEKAKKFDIEDEESVLS